MAEERVLRRLAAILAADVVGYSRLIRADEEGTLAALKTLHADIINPKTAEHNGRIVKLMGDGLLAEFSSVVEAVRTSAEVQRALAERNAGLPKEQRIEFRIGVNLGDVVIDGDDIQGDGINVASRLEGLSEPGGMCISGAVYDQVRDRIDLVFEDLGDQEVKNIDRPVRAWRWAGDASATSKSISTTDAPLPLPDKPSIAVLPFENISGDPEQEYFADGIAEDIITALSKFHWFFVIARNSSFSYKGSSPDIRQVANELGVQYVLEGSVRKAGNRVRITAQLIDALSGHHIWAERYDRDLEDIFAIQDEITQEIAGAVAPTFVSAEARRVERKAPEHFDAWDYAMRGNWHLWQFSPVGVAEAKRLFARAIELDPGCSIALCGTAFAYQNDVFFGRTDDPEETLMSAYQFAQRAATANESDAWAHAILGWLNVMTRKTNPALESCRRALDLNPNLAFAEGVLGMALAVSGRVDEAIPHSETAARLSPRDPATGFLWRVTRSITSFIERNYAEQVGWARGLTEIMPENPMSWRHFSVAAAHNGQLDDARAALEQLLRLVPHDSILIARNNIPLTRTEDVERFCDGLRKAGLRE